MAIEGDLIYEQNENGERVVVKSIESTSRVYLRFTNGTKRPVDVWWRDFDGKRRHYFCLAPGVAFDINTFITHPWEFTDRATKEHFMINNKPIFKAPANLGGMVYRTNWNISIGMRTLRHTALLRIALIIPEPRNVYELDLPHVLENELMTMISALKMVDRPEER